MNIWKIALMALLTGLIITGCKKDEEPEETPSLGIHEQGSNDETARNEYDQSVDDVFKALENTEFGSRGSDSGGVILPCGVVSIDTTGGKYKIVYGKNCGRKVLSGSITATIMPSGNKWRDKGTVVKLEYTNYTVKFDVNNQTLVFNGTLYVTNVNGGLVYETIISGKTIVHKVRGAIEITFDNGKTRTWNVTKRRIYRSATATTKDLQTVLEADSSNSIAEWGTNKNGETFVTTIPIGLLMENCNSSGHWTGPYVMTQGELVYTVGQNSLKAEPGYTLNNGTLTAVNDCSSDGYKLTWTINGVVTEQFQYY
jgi:hypothetical protein